MQNQVESFYLAGASWCPHTQAALKDLQGSNASVLGRDLNSVLTVLNCDTDNADHPACLTVHGFPAIVACNQFQQCNIVLDGYVPDYPGKTSIAIEYFLSH